MLCRPYSNRSRYFYQNSNGAISEIDIDVMIVLLLCHSVYFGVVAMINIELLDATQIHIVFNLYHLVFR